MDIDQVVQVKSPTHRRAVDLPGACLVKTRIYIDLHGPTFKFFLNKSDAQTRGIKLLAANLRWQRQYYIKLASKPNIIYSNHGI